MDNKYITTFYHRDNSYVIVKNPDGFYCAINKKYIDNAGRLTKTLNGLQMAAALSLNQCINNIRVELDTDYYIKQGMPVMEAMLKAING